MLCSFETKHQNTTILETYLKKHCEKPFRLEATLTPFFWFLFMMRYHCIVFLFRQSKFWTIPDKTGNTFENYTKTKPSVLYTTLPANK